MVLVPPRLLHRPLRGESDSSLMVRDHFYDFFWRKPSSSFEAAPRSSSWAHPSCGWSRCHLPMDVAFLVSLTTATSWFVFSATGQRPLVRYGARPSPTACQHGAAQERDRARRSPAAATTSTASAPPRRGPGDPPLAPRTLGSVFAQALSRPSHTSRDIGPS